MPNQSAGDSAVTAVGVEPVLVLGIGRSGTTLLMQLLGTSPRIAFDRIYPFEVRYLSYLTHWTLQLQSTPAPDEGWNAASVVTPPAGRTGPLPYPDAKLWNGARMRNSCFLSAWRAFSDMVTASATAGEEPIYYAEKAPFWLPAVCRQTIPYRAVLLVRDPRDVFVSVRAFDVKRGFSGFGFSAQTNESEADHARRFAAVCRERLRIISNETTGDRYCLMKYEEMVADLHGQARRLGDWLGVQLSASEVERNAGAFAHHTTSQSACDSVGRWRAELASDTANLLTDELRDELGWFGYKS